MPTTPDRPASFPPPVAPPAASHPASSFLFQQAPQPSRWRRLTDMPRLEPETPRPKVVPATSAERVFVALIGLIRGLIIVSAVAGFVLGFWTGAVVLLVLSLVWLVVWLVLLDQAEKRATGWQPPSSHPRG